MHRNMRIILCMARIIIGSDPDKKPTNLSLGKKLKAAAVAYCKDHRIPLSELVSGLLEEKIATHPAPKKARAAK